MSRRCVPAFGALLLLFIALSTTVSIASSSVDVESSASRFDASRGSRHFAIDAADVLADPRAAFASWSAHYSRPVEGSSSSDVKRGGCHRGQREREEETEKERARFDAWASNVLPRARKALSDERSSRIEINGVADVPLSTLRAGLLPARAQESRRGSSGFDDVVATAMEWVRFPYAADAFYDALARRSSASASPSSGGKEEEETRSSSSPFLFRRSGDRRRRPAKPLPASVDWSRLDVLGPVKNQHINNTPCGCCWSFATTGVVEGVVGVVASSGGRDKARLPPPSLSEQQLIDCDRGPPFDDLGCQGGSVEGGVNYIVSNHGRIDTEEDYPYTGVDGDGILACRRRKERKRSALDGAGARVVGFRDVPRKSESALKAAVARHPVAVAVCCGDFIDDWHAYTGGIMTFNGSVTGCPKPLDHAVVVVGYGSGAVDPSDPKGERRIDYWLVKNSWGDQWGMGGYFMLARGLSSEEFPKGAAGLLSMPNYPVVVKDDDGGVDRDDE